MICYGHWPIALGALLRSQIYSVEGRIRHGLDIVFKTWHEASHCFEKLSPTLRRTEWQHFSRTLLAPACSVLASAVQSWLQRIKFGHVQDTLTGPPVFR